MNHERRITQIEYGNNEHPPYVLQYCSCGATWEPEDAWDNESIERFWIGHLAEVHASEPEAR